MSVIATGSSNVTHWIKPHEGADADCIVEPVFDENDVMTPHILCFSHGEIAGHTTFPDTKLTDWKRMIHGRIYPATGPDSIYCKVPDCDATSADGPIYRTSPKGPGQKFEGKCSEHINSYTESENNV